MKKKMKHSISIRICITLAIAAMLALSLAACGGGEKAGSASADKPLKLTLGQSVPADDYRGLGAKRFVERVKELSDGKIVITQYPSETLTTSQDAVKQVGSGVADMGTGALSFSVSEIPALAPLDIPGIYNPNDYRNVVSEIQPILDEILEPQGVKTLIFFDETQSVFYLNNSHKREVHSPADIKGLRLRDHGAWIGKAISEWGASPMSIVPADLAVALERGTVDGGFTGWSAMLAFGCVEPAPNITFPGLSNSTFAPVMINLDVWNGLSKEQQDIFNQAARDAEKYSDEQLAAYYEKFTAAVKENGGSIYTMTPDETKLFAAATKPLVKEARKSSGDLGNKLIDKFEEIQG